MKRERERERERERAEKAIDKVSVEEVEREE